MEFCADAGAERSVLAGLCSHGKAGYLEVSDLLTSESFTVPDNKAMWSVLSYIREKDLECAIDYHTIIVAAKELKLSEALGDEKYIRRIITFNSELSNLRSHAKKIRKLQETRGLVGKLNDTAEQLSKISGSESMAEIVTIAEKPIFEFIDKVTLDGVGGICSVYDGLPEYITKLESGEEIKIGLSTGCKIYDKCIGYLRPGVHICFARKKTGKSMFAINVALYNAYYKVPVLYLDTELRLENGQWARMIARLSNIKIDNIEDGSYAANPVWKAKVHKARGLLSRIPLDYINVSGMEFDVVLSTIRRWLVQKVGYNKAGKLNDCLVIYDYLKLTNSNPLKMMQEYQALGFRMQQLHDITVQYNFPCFAFAQANKEMELAASDRISWFATSVANFAKKTEDEIGTDGRNNGNRKLIVEDARFGPGMDDGDYINMDLKTSICYLTELKTRNELGRSRNEVQPEPVENNDQF